MRLHILRHPLSLLLWSLSLLLLSGCQSTPPFTQQSQLTPELTALFNAQNNRLRALQQWQLAGKLAIIQPQQRQSSRINWQQSGPSYELTLTNLLGVTLLAAHQSETGASLEFDGKHYQAAQMAELLNQLSGLNLPVEQLTQWLKAAIDPNTASQLQVDERGQLLYFEQSLPGWGLWQVSYNGYYPATAQQPALPSLITLQCQDLTIKLLIHQWKTM